MTEKQLVALAASPGCQLWFTIGTMELEQPAGESAPQGTYERSARGCVYVQETLEKYQASITGADRMTGVQSAFERNLLLKLAAALVTIICFAWLPIVALIGSRHPFTENDWITSAAIFGCLYLVWAIGIMVMHLRRGRKQQIGVPARDREVSSWM